jgi:hypothetical protein
VPSDMATDRVRGRVVFRPVDTPKASLKTVGVGRPKSGPSSPVLIPCARCNLATRHTFDRRDKRSMLAGSSKGTLCYALFFECSECGYSRVYGVE